MRVKKVEDYRDHVTVDGFIGSIYTTTNRCANGAWRLDETIMIKSFDSCSIIVSKSRRVNNDWYEGRKKMNNKLYNKSTGNLSCLLEVMSTIESIAINSLIKDGYYALTFESTDERRNKMYVRFIKRIVKKYGLKIRTYDIYSEDTLFVIYA